MSCRRASWWPLLAAACMAFGMVGCGQMGPLSLPQAGPEAAAGAGAAVDPSATGQDTDADDER